MRVKNPLTRAPAHWLIKQKTMRFAIFSDIHGNWEALETALDHCLKARTESFLLLGDTIGYGANPNECLRWAVKNARIHLLGNHEKVVIDPEMIDWFTDLARESSLWTARILETDLKEAIRKMSYFEIESGFSLVHGSFHRPEEFDYLHSYQDALPAFAQMKTSVGFVGHTHIPCCICEREKSARRLEPGILQLKASERYILNPGSLGQPRDGDSRLAFGIFDDENLTFEIVRLKYDNEKAARKIRRTDLPAFFADRLL